MSSPSPAQPDPGGSPSPESAPWVVVRASKHYVCSSCGTWVEIPDDVVGKWVVAYGDSSQQQAKEKRPEEAVEQPAPTQTEPAPIAKPAVVIEPNRQAPTEKRSQASGSKTARPSRPKRPQAPKRKRFAGEMIDGLVVPTGQQLDRALAWVSFHMKVLDRQGSEFHRLQKQLKVGPACRGSEPGYPLRDPRPAGPTDREHNDSVSCPRGHANEVGDKKAGDSAGQSTARHPHADVGMAPRSVENGERGPP